MKIRKFHLILFNAICLCFNFVFSNETPQRSDQLRIACVGDSITYGSGLKDRDISSYPVILERLLGDSASVSNFGVSGATLLKNGDKPYWDERAYSLALKSSPDVVIIKLGTNDTKPDNWNYESEYVSDYAELVKSFQNLDSEPTVWICYPVPSYSESWGIRDVVLKAEMLPMIAEVAITTNAKIINLYAPFNGRSDLFPDAVHPNEEGAQKIAELVAAALGSLDTNNERL